MRLLFDIIVDFSPDLAVWVKRLQREAERQDSSTFPIDILRQLAQFEVSVPECQTQSHRYFVALAYGCLSTAFIMTQRHAAIRRLETSDNPIAASRWLPEIRGGEAFATVGISHLTTSRRHLATPPVQLHRSPDGWFLRGSIPWVTGGPYARYLVVGAVDEADIGKQYLFLVDCETPGVLTSSGMDLVALTKSCTDVVELDDVAVTEASILHGPSPNVMAASNTGGAGGLQTSALAIGLAAAAIDYLIVEGEQRPGLLDHARVLTQTWSGLYDPLRLDPQVDSNRLRKESNDLALQSTQAALAAAKGAGFVEGHPVGRWCKEALFFLVWSCPQVVAEAHMCSFSGWSSPKE